MTDDEKALYDLVRTKMPTPTSATKADVEAIRTLVTARKSLFPVQFIEVLFDANDPTYTRHHSARFTSLYAILDAHEAIPETLRATVGDRAAIEEALDPTFLLDPDELVQVLNLCAKIREAITRGKFFDVPHKRRLLDRVAAIEREAHQPKGRFDVILGGVSDFGEALGKFGKDVKPLVDRMTEIMGIARGKSEEYEQLPPPEEVKRLPPPDDTKGGGA